MKTNPFLIGSIAVVVAVIAILPHVVIPLLTPPDIRYAPMLKKGIAAVAEDEVIEGGRIRKTFHGQVIPREGYLYEHRYTPQPREWLPHFLLGIVNFFTGSLPMTFALGDLLLAPLLFLMMYFFIYKLIRDPVASIFCALTILFLTPVLDLLPPRHFIDVQKLIATLATFTQPTALLFTRLPHPELSYQFFWAALIALMFLLEKESKFRTIGAGVSWGLLFYTYPYFWQGFYSGLGLLLLYLSYKREWKAVVRILWACAVAAMVSLPCWYQLVQALNLPYSEDHWLRHGTRQGRYLYKFLTLKYFVVLLIGWGLVRRWERKAVFLTCFILGGLVCLNQQLIIGRALQPDHWTFRILTPWSVIFLTHCFLVSGFRKWDGLRKIAWGISVVILIWGSWIQVSYCFESRLSHPLMRELKPHLMAFDWINQNTDDHDVILTLDPNLLGLLAAYTDAYHYLANITHTGASFAEAEDRIRTAYKILGVSPADLDKQLATSSDDPERWKYYETHVAPYRKDPFGVLKNIYEQDSWLYTFFQYRYYFDKMHQKEAYGHPPEIREKIEKSSIRYVPFEERRRWLQSYDELPMQMPFLLKKYKLDYVYFSTYERGLTKVNLDQNPFFELAYEDLEGEIKIYRVLSS